MELQYVAIKLHGAWRDFWFQAKKTLKLAKFQDIVFQSHIPNIILLLV